MKGKKAVKKAPKESQTMENPKEKGRRKFESKVKTMEYFPRGGSVAGLELGKKQKSGGQEKEGDDFIFNKAPVQFVKRKRKGYEMEVPELPEKKKKAKAKAEAESESDYGENVMEEGQLEQTHPAKKAGKEEEGVGMTRIRRLVILAFFIEHIENAKRSAYSCRSFRGHKILHYC